jgi:hypothetical protein
MERQAWEWSIEGMSTLRGLAIIETDNHHKGVYAQEEVIRNVINSLGDTWRNGWTVKVKHITEPCVYLLG